MISLPPPNPSAVEPGSSKRPKKCKMALKYAFKPIFLERIFEFMINRAPPTSNCVHGRENWIKYNTAKSVAACRSGQGSKFTHALEFGRE